MNPPAILWTLLLAIAAAPLPPGDHARSVSVAGQPRSYLVHVPPRAAPPTGFPVVLVFHGLGFDAAKMVGFSGMNAKADAAGFLAVYPEGAGAGVLRVFNGGALQGGLGDALPDDVAMTARLLDDLAVVAAIDARRVFAAGMSNGGMMCYRLAAELPDRIAAIAAVAGTMSRGLKPPSRPVPVLHVHGTADRVVPAAGPPAETSDAFRFCSVDETIQFWIRANGCSPVPHRTSLPDCQEDGTSAVRTDYRTPDGDTRVVLITIEGGGHTWPGRPAPAFLGKRSRDVSANDLMWEFFTRHARR